MRWPELSISWRIIYIPAFLFRAPSTGWRRYNYRAGVNGDWSEVVRWHEGSWSRAWPPSSSANRQSDRSRVPAQCNHGPLLLIQLEHSYFQVATCKQISPPSSKHKTYSKHKTHLSTGNWRARMKRADKKHWPTQTAAWYGSHLPLE
jgi:hypothetical protein